MVDVTLIQVPNLFLASPLMYPFSLSLMYLAASLERAGAKVALADLRDKELSSIDLDTIPPARYFGFTATTGEISAARTLAALLKDKYPDSQTVVGGAHASVLPEDCQPHFDIVAVGEWDYAIVNLFQKGHTNGIVYANQVSDLDSLPLPARHLAGTRAFTNILMPGEKYGTGNRAAMLISSRGCPQTPACAFCANITRGVRFRSPENVLLEVEELVERYNVREWRDEADNLTTSKKWLLEYCRLLAPLKVSWKGHTRADYLDEDEVIAMKEAGLVEFGIGVESADPEVLRIIRKKETVEDYNRAIRLLKKYGVISKVYLMSGLPGETEQTLALNASFFEEAKPDKWTLLRFVPLPGCDIWQHPENYRARIDRDQFANFVFWPTEGPIEYEGVSKQVLDARFNRMYSYLRSDKWRQ